MRKTTILLILMISLMALVACTNASNTNTGVTNGNSVDAGVDNTALESTVDNSISEDFSESDESVEIGSMI